MTVARVQVAGRGSPRAPRPRRRAGRSRRTAGGRAGSSRAGARRRPAAPGPSRRACGPRPAGRRPAGRRSTPGPAGTVVAGPTAASTPSAARPGDQRAGEQAVDGVDATGRARRARQRDRVGEVGAVQQRLAPGRAAHDLDPEPAQASPSTSSSGWKRPSDSAGGDHR